MKTVVHTEDAQRPALTTAMLVYEGDECAYVTVHPAGHKNGRADIGPGIPASRAALAELAVKLAKATTLAGFIPPTLLYTSPRLIAWWRPAAPARVYFKQAENLEPNGRQTSPIGTRSGVTPQPHLVFAVTAAKWFVWAVSAADPQLRPNALTPLCRAPHFNVWSDGEICTGNVKRPDQLTPEVLGDYEAAFFGSNFTHPNDPQGLTRHAKGPYAMWIELLKGRRRSFPDEWLAPLQRATRHAKKAKDAVTLASAIKVLEGERDDG